MSEPTMAEKLETEFGGLWQSVDDGTTLVGTYAPDDIGLQVVTFLEKCGIASQCERLDSATTIMIEAHENIEYALNQAAALCGRTAAPEKGDVTMSSILHRVSSAEGGQRIYR